MDDVDNHLYTYGVGTLYMDIIQECEKLGDYVVNVAEARMGSQNIWGCVMQNVIDERN